MLALTKMNFNIAIITIAYQLHTICTESRGDYTVYWRRR